MIIITCHKLLHNAKYSKTEYSSGSAIYVNFQGKSKAINLGELII